MKMSIRVTNDRKVIKTNTNFTRNIPEAGRAGLWNFAQSLAKALREAAPEGASGRMSSTKGTRAVRVNKNEYVIKMPFYTKYVESGTQPHWIPMNRHKLTRWANMKGINSARLRNYIAKHGTKAHPFTAKVYHERN